MENPKDRHTIWDSTNKYIDVEGCPIKLIKKAKRVLSGMDNGIHLDHYVQLVWDIENQLLEVKSFSGDTPLDYQVIY